LVAPDNNYITSEVADFSDDNFATISGFPHLTQMSVMPIVAYHKDEIRPLGTCFAISNHGIVLTARHVIDEALSIVPELGKMQPADGWWVGALYAAEPLPHDTSGNLNGGILPARTVNFQNELDIAAIHLNLPTNTITNELLRMPALRLSPGLPKKGENCFAMGYHAMTCDKGIVSAHSLTQSYSSSKGTINEIYLPRRDSSMLRFPCFETTSRFDGGMSGGPIIGENGNVIGVVCSTISAPDDIRHTSYGSLIAPALLLQMEAMDNDGKIRKAFLHDFVEGGSIVTDETKKALIIKRTNNTLEIRLGNGTIRSVLTELIIS
jgi:S1-C subfamily serine protease